MGPLEPSQLSWVGHADHTGPRDKELGYRSRLARNPRSSSYKLDDFFGSASAVAPDFSICIIGIMIPQCCKEKDR